MLSVSEKYSQAIKADSRRMLHRVTLANSIVLDQTSAPKMTLDENIGGNSGVALGTANSASLKLALRDPAVIDYTDMLVEPESGLELPDGTIEWLPLGKFYVTDSSTSNDYKTVELTCADGMYLMSGEYVSALTYPALVRDVAHEIADQAGVELVDLAEWPAIYIRKKPERLTLRNAIGYVAGCCGKNARFNRYGRLEFVWYKDTGLTIERTQQYLDGFTRLNDQSLNVNFNVTGETEKYKVTVISDDNGNVIANPGTNVLEGDTVTLSVVPLYQYELSSISAVSASGASITLWQNAEGNEYTFTQPDSDVTVNVTFKFVESASGGGAAVSGGEYSFLQHPSLAAPSNPKPYWAIFYKHDTDVGPNAKYYLVWFDSWTLGSGISLEGDKSGYEVTFDGYYYCQGANNGSAQHYWDDAVWQGNGESGAALTWRVGVGRWCDGYGLLASNASLGEIFTANASEVGSVQSSWLVDGVDVREKGAFSLYACPDTYSTPLPGKYWMLTNRARVYKTDTDGSYTSLYSGSSEIYALFFDGCVVTDLGKYYSFNDGNYLKLTFSKLTIVPYLGYDEFYASGAKTIDEECYIIIADPDYSSDYASGGGLEYPIGLYATNLSSSYFSNNSPMVCDCASSASVAKFAMRRSTGAIVTIDYTNPMITSKMVDGISAVVEGVSYTPSKVKHRGNPALEAGDIVTVPDKDGNYHTVLIMQQTMVFGGGMNATITCPGQTEKKSSFSTTGALTSQIQKVVQEESYYQKKESDTYNSTVVSALSRSMSSLSRQVTADGIAVRMLNEWRGQTDIAISELTVKTNDHSVKIESLAKKQSDTETSMATLQQNVSANSAVVSILAQWKSNVEDDVDSIASIKTTADKNTSSITSLTNMSNALVQNYALLDQRVTDNEAAISSNAQWKNSINASMASVTQTANANSSSISSFAAWQNTAQGDIDDLETALGTTNANVAAITQTVNSQGASIGMVVKNGTVQGSVLVQAINNQSTAKIAADKLDIEGKTLNIKVNATNIEGALTIGQLPSTVAQTSQIPTTAGIVSIIEGTVTADYINARGGITTSALTVTNTSGQVMFSADASAHSVQAGGFYIDHNSLYTYPTFRYSGLILCSTGTESTIAVNGVSQKGWKILAGPQGSAYKYFGVDSNGYMYAEGADISGKIASYQSDGTVYCSIDPAEYGFVCSTGIVKSGTTIVQRGATVSYNANGISAYYNGVEMYESPLVEIFAAIATGQLNGTWKLESGAAITSDRTKKNSIEDQAEVYSRIFDRLNPVTFKYNHGKSDRTHFGLVAQDVEDAVLAEGLTTKEFAPVVYDIDEDGNKVNYGIRYEELVSLCIYEIQKLKSRLEKTNG